MTAVVIVHIPHEGQSDWNLVLIDIFQLLDNSIET